MAAPTKAKKRLGAHLFELRTGAKASVSDAAAELKASDTTVNRYESGHVFPVWGTVRTLLTLYNATADDVVRAEQLWQAVKDDEPPVRLPAGTPKAFRRLVTAERDEACAEHVIDPLVVPGLLQTERYTRALNAGVDRYVRPAAKVDSYVNLRLNRQKRLGGPDPLELQVLIDEAVLLREVGGPDVMREQLTHLLALGERPNITVQVVPFGAGVYGTMSGSCHIVLYPDPADGPHVYLEHLAGGAWVENEEDVRCFTTMFDDTAKAALTPAETVDRIRQQTRALADR